ncbi:hypothetical protein [Citricoccus nitrophenolicus]|uniref:hypothetical protein n=1 Tax=Citricoccus nitrophenolicus TaxID=863575 RepID=UPI0031EFC08A
MANNNLTQTNGRIWRLRASAAKEHYFDQAKGAFLYEFRRKEDSELQQLMESGPCDEEEARAWLTLDILTRRLVVERWKLWRAILAVKDAPGADLTEACSTFNEIVSVAVGYQQAMTSPPLPCDDPVALGRAEERVECFLEELVWAAKSFISGSDGRQEALAWDESKFHLRSMV